MIDRIQNKFGKVAHRVRSKISVLQERDLPSLPRFSDLSPETMARLFVAALILTFSIAATGAISGFLFLAMSVIAFDYLAIVGSAFLFSLSSFIILYLYNWVMS